MINKPFPVIDPIATGENIAMLRKARNFSVRDLQEYFGFEDPQAIYKWQKGKSLPSVDNLYALSSILDVPIEGILVRFNTCTEISTSGRDSAACFYIYACGASKWESEFNRFISVTMLKGFTIQYISE